MDAGLELDVHAKIRFYRMTSPVPAAAGRRLNQVLAYLERVEPGTPPSRARDWCRWRGWGRLRRGQQRSAMPVAEQQALAAYVAELADRRLARRFYHEVVTRGIRVVHANMETSAMRTRCSPTTRRATV
jgi:hypothetical protein